MAYAGSQHHQGPGYLNDPLKPFLPPVSYDNTEQSCTNTCPDGTTGEPITVVVTAGTYHSTISQEDADDQAHTAACAQAAVLREASPCVSADTCMFGFGPNVHSELGDNNGGAQYVPDVLISNVEWIQISVGVDHTLAVKSDGTLWAWGANYFGALGTGNTSSSSVPIQVGTDTDWASVSAGGEFSAGIKKDGTLWAWGFNSAGQLGLGDTTRRLSPVQVGVATNWDRVVTSAGEFTVARQADGTLWSTGYNGFGQLGVGDTTNRHVMTQIGVVSTWANFSVGLQHACAIRANGTLWSWGRAADGQLGDGSDTPDVNAPLQIGAEANWSKVACGYSWTSALKTTGTLWSTGDNQLGQLGLGDEGTGNDRNIFEQVGTATDWGVIPARQGHYTFVALKTNGSLWTCGRVGPYLGQGPSVPANVLELTATSPVRDYSYVDISQDNTLALAPCDA